MRRTSSRLAALAATALLAACAGGTDPVQPRGETASAAEVAAAMAAVNPTPYGVPGVSAAAWMLPPGLPAELALTAEQQGQIRAITAAYDVATRADREVLLAAGRELAAAQRAGATRQQLRAIADRAAPAAARLAAASRQLEADVAAVLTPAQRAWLAAQRQRAATCARLAGSPEFQARVAELTRAYAAQTEADRQALAAVMARLDDARRANATRAQLDAILAEARAVLDRLTAAGQALLAGIAAAQTPEMRALGCAMGGPR